MVMTERNHSWGASQSVIQMADVNVFAGKE